MITDPAISAGFAGFFPGDQADSKERCILSRPGSIRAASQPNPLAEYPYFGPSIAHAESLLHYMPILVIELDPDGTVLFINQTTSLLTEYPLQKIQGRNWWNIFCPGELQVQATELRQLMAIEDVVDYEITIRTKKGEHVRILWNTVNIYHVDGSLGRIRAFCVNSERLKQNGKHGERTAHELRTLFNCTGDAIFVYDLKGTLLEINRAACEYLGYTRDELFRRCILDFETPIFSNPVFRHLDQLFYYCYAVLETEFIRRDGTIILMEESSQIIEFDGCPAVLVIARDISQRKRLELETNRQNELLKGIVQSILEHIAVLDREGNIIAVNEVWERFCLENGGELHKSGIGSNYLEVCLNALGESSEGAREVLEGIQTVMTGKQQRFLMEYPCHSLQEQRWFLVHVTPLTGGRDGVVVSHINITEHKQAEMGRHLLGSAVEQTGDLIAITDAEGLIQYVNPTFIKVTGYTLKEALGQHVTDLLGDGVDSERDVKIRNFIHNDKTWTGTLVSKKKDGTTFDEEITIFPVHDSQGRIVNMTRTSRDITERTRLESQLRQSQKMEAIGRLAGGIAHDFNNLLTGIKGSIEMALMDLDKENPLREHIEDIQDVTDRAVDLVSQLLALSRRQIVSPKVLNINDVIRNMERMIRRVIGEHINCITSLDSLIQPVKIDSGQLEQVLMNLAINAADAMRGGGKLTLGTRMEFLEEECSNIFPDMKPGWHVVLFVSDTGIGMDKETLSHIYEPFFTTKDRGKGTGLGLSTVYGIVKQSNGHIFVESEQGKGTTFRIYFEPVEGVCETIEHKILKTEGLKKGTEHILVVEDEDVVRRLMQKIMEKAGYTARYASNAEEAMELCRGMNGSLDLLITDLVLPDLNGMELSRQILSKNPRIKVLYMSGYTDDVISGHLMEDQKNNFIAKPFNMMDFLKRVRDILDTPDGKNREMGIIESCN